MSNMKKGITNNLHTKDPQCKVVRACQTCLDVIEDDSTTYSFNFPISDNRIRVPLKTLLEDVIPELLLENVDDAVLCQACFKSTLLAYRFKHKCLENQSKVYGYLQQLPVGTKAEITEIALYYKRVDTIAKESQTFNRSNISLDQPEVQKPRITHDGHPNICPKEKVIGSSPPFVAMKLECASISGNASQTDPATSTSMEISPSVANYAAVNTPGVAKGKKKYGNPRIRLRLANGVFIRLKKQELISMDLL